MFEAEKCGRIYYQLKFGEFFLTLFSKKKTEQGQENNESL